MFKASNILGDHGGIINPSYWDNRIGGWFKKIKYFFSTEGMDEGILNSNQVS